ncbi:MAG: ABC transporter substrate-binding protein [Paludibacteraceae bacterium]|nr:ABC transporter substrate-binding protein [Paludibacteraceae bacterium]
MVDNSWIKNDRKISKSPQSRIIKTKVTLTIAILIIGALLTVAMNGVGSNVTQYKSEGIVVDFGDYNTIWTNADFNITEDPVILLDDVKQQHVLEGFDYQFDNGRLWSVSYDGSIYTSGSDGNWDLWFVPVGEYDAVKSDTYELKASDYTVVMWAFTSAGEVPAVAVDATATSIYGYAEPFRVVSLSPVCTETINSVSGIQKLVGTDSYSNYPEYVVKGHEDGSISIVGSYTDPSYEALMSTSPELVYCDASTYNDVQMSAMLRSSNVNTVVLYNGENIDTIIKNIFITGTSMNHGLGAKAYIEKIYYSMEEIKKTVTQEGVRVMVSLSNDPAPWVAGNNTYINDILESLGAVNVFSDVIGWTNITPESIMKKNPDCIIIIDSYRYTKDGYSDMMSILSNEWKYTNAYKEGNVYLYCESFGDLGSRAGPRFVQLMEIMALSIDSEDSLPKSIGNDYRDYLEITGRMAD